MIKRARIQIIHTILQVPEEGPESGICVTKLLFLTGLSHDTLKSYLSVLVDSGLVAIIPPTKEQTFLRPAIKRYVVSTRKSEIFLKLYTQSRDEDLIWWETNANNNKDTTTQTRMYQEAEKQQPPDGEERQQQRRRVRQYNLFGSSKTQ